MKLKINDEIITSRTGRSFTLNFNSSKIKIKDLIRQRVCRETETLNKNLPDLYQGLVVPPAAKKVGNGYQIQSPQPVDSETHCDAAFQAFNKNGFFIFVDGDQVNSLEQEIDLRPNTELKFVLLSPVRPA